MGGKPGRNDPCPCGSGKKYKRCCLGSGTEQEHVLMPVQEGRYPRFRTFPMGRLAVMWLSESTLDDPVKAREIYKRLGMTVAHARRVRERHWDLDKVRAMGTPDIIARLRSMGIDLDEARFVELAAGSTSAVQLSEDHWYDRELRFEGEFDGDVPWLAAIVLWERLLPERSCIEMADEAMQKGYVHLGAGRQRKALEAWDRAWSLVLELVPADVTSVEGADAGPFRETAQSLFAWCQHVEEELAEAAQDDPEYHRKRSGFCRAFRERFPGTNEELLQVMMWAEAGSVAARGDLAAADRLFEALVSRFPKGVWGYTGWGDVYAATGPDGTGPLDFARAESIYLRGLEACRGDADIDEIRDRLVALWW